MDRASALLPVKLCGLCYRALSKRPERGKDCKRDGVNVYFSGSGAKNYKKWTWDFDE